MVMLGTFISMTVAKVGVIVFAGCVLFTVITLPVEIDASMRAKRLILENNIVTGKKASGVSAVFTAAAATSLATALQSILQLLYFTLRPRLLGGRDD